MDPPVIITKIFLTCQNFEANCSYQKKKKNYDHHNFTIGSMFGIYITPDMIPAFFDSSFLGNRFNFPEFFYIQT